MIQAHTPAPRQLLAVLVGALLAGQTLAADIAGRISFVSGTVSAISADGSRRDLSKGDLVYGGERLETGRGRLQVRFTDSSFLSLQPNTVFRIDRYSYDRAKPEQGSLQFNFLRGGMRTVTGAIGRVNRANYTVRSPVATIGIRGTGYASTMENAVLTLSVDKGIVHLSNPFGASDVGVGQTYQVHEGEAPQPAPEGVNAPALAQAPDSDANGARPDPLAETGPALEIRAGELIGGEPPFLVDVLRDSVYPPQSGEPTPGYSLASRFVQSGGIRTLSNVGAFFNQNATDASRGALLALTETGDDRIVKLFELGTLQARTVTTQGGLSFGEWTDGHAQVGRLDRGDIDITLGAGRFEPYIVGVTSMATLGLDNLGQATRLNYSLTGATAARSSLGTENGVLQALDLGLTLSPVPVADVRLSVRMDQSGDYVATGNNLTVSNNVDSNQLSTFQVNGLRTQQGQGCGTGGCSVALDAFLANNNQQAGVVYEIGRASDSIGGVGALGLSGTQTVPVPVQNVTTGP